MKGYKGFNPGLICKGKQYQENKWLDWLKAPVEESEK